MGPSYEQRIETEVVAKVQSCLSEITIVINMKQYRRYRTSSGIYYYAFPVFKKKGIELVYTSKKGMINGVSCDTDMKYSGMQKKFLESFGFNIEHLETVKQVHRGECIIINSKGSIYGDKEKADGIISASAQKILGISTADCIAVGLASTENRIIALLHCGWRGLVAGIIPHTINILEKEFGVNPSSLLAGMGPSVGVCCYPVGDDVVTIFRETFPFTDRVISRINSNQFCIDLKKTAKLILTGCNLYENSIFSIDLCTSCNKDSFYSYRRDGNPCGRLMAFMAWIPDTERAIQKYD